MKKQTTKPESNQDKKRNRHLEAHIKTNKNIKHENKPNNGKQIRKNKNRQKKQK